MALKILMVAPQPFFRARGTPFSVLHRIRALTVGGHKVTLVTYPFGEDIAMDGLVIVRAKRPPMVKDVAIGPSVGKVILDLPLYLKTTRQLKNGSFDVIHSHEEAAIFCVALARKHSIPHIYDMHSSLPQQLKSFARFDFKPIEQLFLCQENRVLSTCNGVITICEDLARIIDERGVDVPHSMIENTGDDQMVFSATQRDIRAEFDLVDAEIVLYTGTFEVYQGLDLLSQAFKQIAAERPRVRLMLVGGRDVQVEDYRRELAEKGLEDRVTLVGTVHPSEIPSFLAAADLIVSPRSSGTNTPLKIYGYMRSGKPIVATDRLTHTQSLSKDTAELVQPTPEGLAQGMSRVLSDPNRAESLALAAAAYVEREYSDAAYIDKVNDLYARVISDVSAADSEQRAASV